MRILPRLLPLLLLLVVAQANDALLHARRAQALLGPDVWSRLVRVENRARPGAYPRTVYALVFEFMGRLWFYADVNGTQSFSLHAGRLEQEKADFGPLLRDIEPGFQRWSVLPDDGTAAGPLPNGCFIESVALLRARLAQGRPVSSPQLLSYYVDTHQGRRGHTVLLYRDNERTVVCDPARALGDFSLPTGVTLSNALEVARTLEGPAVVKAQFLAIPLPAKPALA